MFKELSPDIPEYYKESCIDCNGSGEYGGCVCKTCHGKGWVSVELKEEE